MKQCTVGQVDDRHSSGRRSRCVVTGDKFGTVTSEVERGEGKSTSTARAAGRKPCRVREQVQEARDRECSGTAGV